MRFEFTGSGVEKLYEQLVEGTADAREHNFEIEILYNNRQPVRVTRERHGLFGIKKQAKVSGEQVELVLGTDEEAFGYYSAQLHTQGIFPKNDFTVRNTVYSFTSQPYRCVDRDSVPGPVNSAERILNSRSDLKVGQNILSSTKTEDVPGKRTETVKQWVYVPDSSGYYIINLPRAAGEPEYVTIDSYAANHSSKQEPYKREMRDVTTEVQIVIPTTVYYKALDARVEGDARDILGLKNEIEHVIQAENSCLIFNP